MPTGTAPRARSRAPSAALRRPLSTDLSRTGDGAEAYLGYGTALGLVLMLVLGLGLGLGPIELVLLAPVAVLATVWLAIGVIAKGVEVGRRASHNR